MRFIQCEWVTVETVTAWAFASSACHWRVERKSTSFFAMCAIRCSLLDLPGPLSRYSLQKERAFVPFQIWLLGINFTLRARKVPDDVSQRLGALWMSGWPAHVATSVIRVRRRRRRHPVGGDRRGPRKGWISQNFVRSLQNVLKTPFLCPISFLRSQGFAFSILYFRKNTMNEPKCDRKSVTLKSLSPHMVLMFPLWIRLDIAS